MFLYQSWTRPSTNFTLRRVHVRGLPANTVLPRYRDRSSSANTMLVRTLSRSCVRPHDVDTLVSVIRVLRCPSTTLLPTTSATAAMVLALISTTATQHASGTMGWEHDYSTVTLNIHRLHCYADICIVLKAEAACTLQTTILPLLPLKFCKNTGCVSCTVEGVYCYWPGRSSMQTAATAIADTTTTTTIATTYGTSTTITGDHSKQDQMRLFYSKNR